MSSRFTVLKCGLLCLFLVSACGGLPTAQAASVTSTNFSIGFGASIDTTDPTPPGQWSTAETNSVNTPVTTGNANTTTISIGPDFELTPIIAGRQFSDTGATFPNRVLTNNGGQSGWSRTFSVDLTGAYTGILPPGAVNVQTTLNLTGLSIYAMAYNGGSFVTDVNNFHFNETTPGNTASSPNAAPLTSTTSTGALDTASNYTQLVWDPSEQAVAGTSSTRSFTTSGFGVVSPNEGYVIEGFEIFGTIEVTYNVPIPEPSTFTLLGIALLGLSNSKRRSRRQGKIAS